MEVYIINFYVCIVGHCLYSDALRGEKGDYSKYQRYSH